MLCQIVVGPQFQNFMLNVASFLGRKAFENLDWYPKINPKKCVNSFLMPATGGNVFFDFFKAKK